jgi:hypothetical protein
MRSVAEYRQFAHEYRQLLQRLTRPNDKKALDLMARAWDKIAMDREQRLVRLSVRLDVGCGQTAGISSVQARTFDCRSGASDSCAIGVAPELRARPQDQQSNSGLTRSQ